MPTFEIDDQACFNAKVLRAGNEAFGAWCRAGSWCMANLTDGYVTRDVAILIAPEHVWATLRDCGLPGAGLVEPVDGDDGALQIHDWDHWQRSAAEIRKHREQQAIRQRNHRAAKRAHKNVTRDNPRDVTRDVPRESRPPDPHPNPHPKEESTSTLSLTGPESKNGAEQVFDHWRGALMPRAKQTAKRIQRIKARLKEGFSPQDLCKAVDGALADDWIMGRDPKARPGGWRDLETILRDAAQVERLVALADDPPADTSWEPWTETTPNPEHLAAPDGVPMPDELREALKEFASKGVE